MVKTVKNIIGIIFEVIPFVFFPLSFTIYKFGTSAITLKGVFALYTLCLPSMVEIGVFGDKLKTKYKDFFA